MLNAEKYKERIKELDYRFALCNGELKRCNEIRCDNCEFNKIGCKACMRYVNKWLLEEYKEPILNDEEKIIIKDIIKAFEPFNVEVTTITKLPNSTHMDICYLYFNSVCRISFSSPDFDDNELFKGMNTYRVYTLKELGL